MGFGTGLVTGLASGFDKMLQLDMQRNQDRLSRAETYALTRRQQKLERAETSGRKLKENLRELAALTGSNTRAAMAAEGVGGTNAAIEELVKDLKEERKKLGKGFDIGKFIDFTGEDTLKEPRTLADNFNRFREDIDFSVTMPKDLTKPRGLMGKLGFGLKRDVAADVEGMIDIPSEFTAERDTSAIPAGRISFDEGYQAREFADKFKEDSEDKRYTSGTAMMAHAGQLMLKHPEGTEQHTQAAAMYKMGEKIVQDAKKDPDSDASKVALTDSAAIQVINQIKRTFYNPQNSKLDGESIVPDFKGTDSFKDYFPAQERVIAGIANANNTAYANDPRIQLYGDEEKAAFNLNVDRYLAQFGKEDISENKGVIFKTVKDDEGKTTSVFAGYVNPINIIKAQEDAEKGKYKIGDIVNIEKDGAQVLAVWTGTQWSN